MRSVDACMPYIVLYSIAQCTESAILYHMHCSLYTRTHTQAYGRTHKARLRYIQIENSHTERERPTDIQIRTHTHTRESGSQPANQPLICVWCVDFRFSRIFQSFLSNRNSCVVYHLIFSTVKSKRTSKQERARQK